MDMKRTFIITMLLVLVSMTGWSQTSYFERFEKLQFVDYVKLQGDQLMRKNKLKGNIIDVRDVADKVNYVIAIAMQKPVFVKGYAKSKDDCMTTEVIEAHSSLDYLKKEYVKLLSEQDKHEFTGVYYKEKESDGYEYVIYEEEEREIDIVVISSTLSIDEISKLIKGIK